MDTEPKAGAAVRIPPPLVYVAMLVAGVALQSLWSLPLGLSTGLRVALALLISVLGVVPMAGAIRLFRETGQDPKPWVETPEIVRTGVYRFTRNPMYVSMALLQAAIGIGLGNLWIVILVPVSCAVVQITAIRHEEAYLAGRFGDAYLDYKKSVRRWI